MRELDCYYDIEVEASQINEFGILKPHAYQVLFADIASRHLNSFHLNADDTIKYGMAWALISLHLEHGLSRLYVFRSSGYGKAQHPAAKGAPHCSARARSCLYHRGATHEKNTHGLCATRGA